MDSDLYDDKLAGEITKERYHEKHDQFVTQKADTQKRLAGIETASGPSPEKRIVLLELSQRAS